MKETILAILMGLWSYYWYKLGYVQAQINETQKRIREIYRDIEKRLDLSLIHIFVFLHPLML